LKRQTCGFAWPLKRYPFRSSPGLASLSSVRGRHGMPSCMAGLPRRYRSQALGMPDEFSPA